MTHEQSRAFLCNWQFPYPLKNYALGAWSKNNLWRIALLLSHVWPIQTTSFLTFFWNRWVKRLKSSQKLKARKRNESELGQGDRGISSEESRIVNSHTSQDRYTQRNSTKHYSTIVFVCFGSVLLPHWHSSPVSYKNNPFCISYLKRH